MILCGGIVLLVGKRAKQHQHTAAIDAHVGMARLPDSTLSRLHTHPEKVYTHI